MPSKTSSVISQANPFPQQSTTELQRMLSRTAGTRHCVSKKECTALTLVRGLQFARSLSDGGLRIARDASVQTLSTQAEAGTQLVPLLQAFTARLQAAPSCCRPSCRSTSPNSHSALRQLPARMLWAADRLIAIKPSHLCCIWALSMQHTEQLHEDIRGTRILSCPAPTA